ncbi:unnamed protein product [Lymnaea stagnalis]|uniref:Peptidase M12B domain-containing protein n=1 Tax=Lymnaea stagnalis TaxID=6523 RepID=A0AAV2GYK2_LYMST
MVTMVYWLGSSQNYFNFGNLLVLCFICQIPTIDSSQRETLLRIPCDAKRTEIFLPVTNDVSDLVSPDLQDSLSITLKWRRLPLDVILYKTELTTPETHSEWTQGNVTYGKTLETSCFFHGYVKGQSSSFAALSTCAGLSGYIQTDSEMLFVQPVNSNSTDVRQSHVLYTCEPKRHVLEPEDPSTPHHVERHRRSTQKPKFLEVMVVVDHTLVEDIGSKDRTENYIMTLMNIANTVYQHHTLGVDIRVIVVKIVFLTKSQQKQVLIKGEALQTVLMFCQWSRDQIKPGQPMDYDIAVLITKDELGPSGYAPITGLCDPSRSCAAVKDDGFSTAFVIVHEMAHVFGLFHDGHGNECHGRKYDTAIMAPLVESKLNHFWWSECSKSRMKEMVRYLFCLNNEPKPMKGHYPIKAPSKLENNIGRPWSLDFQCRMAFGDYFKLCAAVSIFAVEPCSVLWCSQSSHPHLCRTKRGPPAPGSSCGHERECRNDVCQYIGNQKPVHGHWNTWASWTPCSSECGVGVRQRTRACENPAPAYGGDPCKGEENIWDTCVNNICENFQDIRAGECEVWDGLQIRHGTHNWQPYEGQNDSSLCLQTCKSFYTSEILTIDVAVADGTPCSYTKNNNNICMEGKCLTVGCDGKINSTKKEDICGVCGGDSSQCKTIQGTFTKKPKSGEEYLSVITFPVNARNIKVMETKQTAQFLALQDPRYATYLLNGDKRQSKDGNLVMNGAMFQYKRTTGSNNETITSHGPIRKPVQVMVYPNKVLDNAAISYSYVVHKSDFSFEVNSYKWKFEKWSECSVSCGSGVQMIVHGCYDKETEEKVDNEKCAFIKAPRKDEVQCRREACNAVSYNYAMDMKYSDCNASCGQEGFQIQKFHCERIFANNNTFIEVADRFCSQLTPPSEIRACKGDPCQAIYNYTLDTEYNPCNATCGQAGVQVQKFHCDVTFSNNSKVKVSDELCSHLVPPHEIQICQGEPCKMIEIYQWSTSEWDRCSCEDSITDSIQRRFVRCEHVTRSPNNDQKPVVKTVAASNCKNVPNKPNDLQKCQETPCQRQYHWLPGFNFGPCNATCGVDGVEVSGFICEYEDEHMVMAEVEDERCANITKPEAVVRPCTFGPCKIQLPKFRWEATDKWKECDAGCNQNGTQTRIYQCQELGADESYSNVRQGLCDKIPRLDETKPCEGPSCTLKWIIGEWSECSVTCGRGKQYRTVYCGDPNTDVDDIRCKDVPPPMSQICNQRECAVVSLTLQCFSLEQRAEDCVDMYLFCSTYGKAITFRCKKENFRRKCCRTCLASEGSVSLQSKNEVNRSIEKRGIRKGRRKRS